MNKIITKLEQTKNTKITYYLVDQGFGFSIFMSDPYISNYLTTVSNNIVKC